MNKSLAFLLLFVTFPALVYTQQHQPTGLQLEDENDHSIPSLNPDGGKYNMLKKSISLKQYCPLPGDQKTVQSCVAWTVGYGALTLLRAMENGQTDQTCLTVGAHSASFIYNQVEKDSCSSSVKFSDAFNLLKKEGDCLSISFQNSTDCNIKPSDPIKQEAAQFKIKDYARLFQQKDKTGLKKDETRRMLAFGLPVIVGLQLTESFWSIEDGQKKWNPTENENKVDFHAMLVVGYNDYDKEFELMNSYGTSWGDQGFIKMSYDDYARLAVYGFVMNRKKSVQAYVDQVQDQFPSDSPISFGTTQSPTHSEVAFSIQEIVNPSPKKLFPLSPFFFNQQEQVYISPKKSWSIGDNFQLLAPNDSTQHIYVLAMDGQGKIHILFEKNKPILTTSPKITMPHKNGAYTLTEKGDNYLCILSGRHAINKFDDKVNQLQAITGAFSSRIQTVFNDILVPSSDIRYAAEHLYFYAFLKERSFVPLFIKQAVK